MLSLGSLVYRPRRRGSVKHYGTVDRLAASLLDQGCVSAYTGLVFAVAGLQREGSCLVLDSLIVAGIGLVVGDWLLSSYLDPGFSFRLSYWASADLL